VAVVNKKGHWRVLASLTACAMAAAVAAVADRPAAWASPRADDAAAAEIRMTVEDILQANPRAREIAPNVVEIDTGLAVLVPPSLQSERDISTLAAEGYTDGHARCDTYWICMWENSFGQDLGYGLAFYDCQGPSESYDLMSYRYPDGAYVGRGTGLRWNDRISSYVNNQTTGTHSWFANWVGDTLYRVLDSYAPSYSEDLAYLEINDIIDAVHSCTA